MHAFSSLPRRRRNTIILNLILVGALWVMILLLSISFLNDGVFVILLLILFSLPFVAIFQYACLIYNLIQGSKIQFWYLIGSLAFLAIYIGSLYGFIDYFDSNEEELGFLLLTGTPTICATIYCYVLYIDHPENYPKVLATRDTLDGGLDLF
jgi:hypothetical protein